MTAHVCVADTDVTFEAGEGQTVLEAAEDAGWAIPYSCRKGVCTTCAGRLVSGDVTVTGARLAGPAADVLLCQAVPAGPVTIAPRSLRASAPPRRKALTATVHRVTHPAPRVCVLELRYPIGRRAPFRPGQYLRVLLDDGDTRLYSMANAPQHNDGAELHVRVEPGGRFSEKVAGSLRRGDSVTVEAPFGEFTLESAEANRPLLLLATGTGIAPIKSMIEHKIAHRDPRPTHLYWGVRRPEDLYLDDLAGWWQQRHAWFRYTPVVSRPFPSWGGRVGYVQDVAAADLTPAQHSVYACGNQAMTEAAHDVLITKAGLADEHFHADAFLPSESPQSQTLATSPQQIDTPYPVPRAP